MTGLPRHATKERRAAGDRFPMTLAIHQAHEETPPVVDKGNQPRRNLATLEVVGCKSGPAPLVFQLVKGVFDMGFFAYLRKKV